MDLETLAGYIFDEDKLVTYKWLSKELGLHVNLSKEILWQFWEKHPARKDVLATFALMGYLADDVYRVEIVKESDLSSAKKKYQKLSSEHLYSLQRALPDLESLALTSPGDCKQAAIVCKEVIPREEEELFVLRWGSRFTDVKASAKSTEKLADPGLKPKPNSGKNMIGNIFGKANKQSKSSVLDIPKESTRGRKRRGSEDREVVSGKKQKRIIEGDSRSSEESANEEEEGEEPEIDGDFEGAAGPAEKNSPPPKYKMENGKRKVRKVIDKITTDENGYLVTNKEYVYESCSDAEESEAPKVVKTTKTQATASKQNRKQASLLNFFKKS